MSLCGHSRPLSDAHSPGCGHTGAAELDSEKANATAASSDTTVRFWLPEFTQEGQWCHLVLLFHRAGIYKNSSVSLYLNGGLVNSQKVRGAKRVVCCCCC